jgi:hypothetical protein
MLRRAYCKQLVGMFDIFEFDAAEAIIANALSCGTLSGNEASDN